MVLQSICPPALIYFFYMTAQIAIDVSRGYYNTALLKFWMAIVITILLNHLCASGLGIFSWFIVSIPIILMTLIIAALLMFFSLDPKTGKMKIKSQKYVTDSNYSGLAQAQTIMNENMKEHHVDKHQQMHEHHMNHHKKIQKQQNSNNREKHLAVHEAHHKTHHAEHNTNNHLNHKESMLGFMF